LTPDATWTGLIPNTAYTARIYSIGKNDDLDSKRRYITEVFSLSFTTSLFKTIEGLASLFQRCKLRDIYVDKSIDRSRYDSIMENLKPEFAPATFTHPEDITIDFHVGMEIFRKLNSAIPFDPLGKTPREVEEEHQKRFDDEISRIRDELKEESLAIEDILNDMGVSLGPSPPKNILATWLRTREDSNGNLGTIGLLIEFPEPIDWHRTGISFSKFKIKIQGEHDEKDLLNLPAGNPSYEVTFYWFRTLDGSKLMLIPKLVKTTISNPRVIIPADRSIDVNEGKLTENIRESESIEVHSEKTGSIGAAKKTSRASTASADRYRNRGIGDYAIPSTVGVHDKSVIDKLKGFFGTTIVQNISNYEVTELEMDFYYFSVNYEDKNEVYRAVPRLRFINVQPGSANGKIGTLIPLK
jgi:hypothetical protein